MTDAKGSRVYPGEVAQFGKTGRIQGFN